MCYPARWRRGSKEASKLRLTGLCEGNSPLTGEFYAQRASNADNVSIWWRHHANMKLLYTFQVKCTGPCVNKRYQMNKSVLSNIIYKKYSFGIYFGITILTDSEIDCASNWVLYTLHQCVFGESLDDICPIVGSARVNMLIYLMLIAAPWVQVNNRYHRR